MISKKGTVVKISGDRTIKVETNEYRAHPKYKKRYRITRNFLAHDPKNEAKIGDTVVIEQCRPVSRKKSFILTEIQK